MPDPALTSADTLSPAQINAANPQGVPQAVSTPGGAPFDLTAAAGSDPRAKKALTDTQELYRKHIDEMSVNERAQEERDDRYRKRMEQMIDQEGATVNDFKPWNAQAELAQHKTDLWSQFGSPGFVIAMIASAFTAQPMNSALQAGGAAMEAINKGDMLGYNKAFEVWKENTELTIKRLNLEHQQIADIQHLRESNMAEWRAKMATILAKFGDERKLALLNNGYDSDLIQAQDAEATSAKNMATATEAIIQNKAMIDALNGHPAQEGEEVTHKDAKGNPMAGGDARWYKRTDPLGAYTDVTKKIKEAEYAGRYGGQPSLSRIQAVTIADRAAELKKEDPTLSDSAALEMAATEIRPAFQQSRSAIMMYMQQWNLEHPKATADEKKAAIQKYTTQITAQNRFLSGPQGNTIRSLNVVVSHLQTMQDLTDALKNNNVPAFNRIAQTWAEQTGQAAPTNFDTAKQIVGAEIIKALGVAGAGSEAERLAAANDFMRARSPEQIAGAIDTARKLLVGQLSGLRRQYIASTGLPGSTFDEMLEPETREFFGNSETNKPVIHFTRDPNGNLVPVQ